MWLGHSCRYNQTKQIPAVKKLVDRLDAVLTALAYCHGRTCRNPWRTLHPDGSVNSLLDAMSPAFDAFYARCSKFMFLICSTHYEPANELADELILKALDEQKWSVPPKPEYILHLMMQFLPFVLFICWLEANFCINFITVLQPCAQWCFNSGACTSNMILNIDVPLWVYDWSSLLRRYRTSTSLVRGITQSR